ncbi:MAG: bifunctional diguanylate cyclase/phosphodiesterase, partial [Planctomycetes bacterium]|nr:bifunctional diguanylate cyclase/phosphodiesterase [Planctomycetota bacterium]
VSAERAAERERAHAAAALQLRAERDTLTGIYNRLAFCERTAKMLRESPDERFVLIRCNVERFKLINDLHGRAVGDRVLRRLADTLRSIAGGIWTFGRLEADHFALCLPKPLAFIEVLQRKIAAGLAQENLESPVLVNFGIYEIEDPGMPVEQMCDRANIALQTIKGNYAHRHAYYDAMLRSAMLQEQEIVSDMEPAMERGEFLVFLQPIYGTDSGGRPVVVAAEALVRWQHPRRGLLAPEAFVPLFERNGYIAKLDYFIWEEVCRFQRARMDAKKPVVPVSVNVSRLNLRNPALAADIKDLADRHRVRYALMPLEITEDAYADGPEQLLKTIGALRQCGFAVYMDDFGSEYSSLNALKDIPFDVIKMDAEFLHGLETSKRGGNIVIAVVRMARSLGKPVVAEGVESEEQVRFLRGIGCDRFQGFYFSPALPLADFAALLDAARAPDAHAAPLVPGLPALVSGDIDLNALFEDDSLAARLLNRLIDGFGVYELADDRLEAVRVNDGYLNVMGY